MSKLKDKMFMIEFVEEDLGCRSTLRAWVEIPGYVEIAYQEFDSAAREWVDVRVLPAYNREDLIALRDSLNVVLDTFV
jgi:hypothetical protein